jgi:hypothetical protein
VYQFNWGDGTTSGWLPQNVNSASHAWTSVGTGTYTVTAQAQTANTLIQSSTSSSTIGISIPTYTLVVNATPGGSIQLCVPADDPPCTGGGGLFAVGTVVTVQASPYANYYFTGFTGALTGTQNPQTITMYGSYTVTANFASVTSISITTSPSLPGGLVGVPYSLALASAGGVPPTSWSLVSGSLPPGIGLSSSGVLSGTPTTPATYNFTVGVNDSDSQSATQSFSLAITPSSTSPQIGSVTQSGGQVTVTGANFGSSGTLYFVIGTVNVPASNPTWGQTAITATLPSGVTGVQVQAGGFYSNAYAFAPAAPPVTLSLSSGPPQMGFKIVSATGGLGNAGGTVTFNGIDLTDLNLVISWTDTAITVQVPQIDVKTYPVVVTLAAGGGVTTPVLFTVTGGFGCTSGN